LDIEVGEHAVDYNELAGKEKLTELQLRVRLVSLQISECFGGLSLSYQF